MSLIDRILEWIHSLPEKPQASVDIFERYRQIILPVPDGAQYSFIVDIYDDPPEADIAATLLDQDREHYFWYMPMEVYDYPSEDLLEQEIKRALSALFYNKSRIIQRKHLFSWSFGCDYASADGPWQELYGIACCRRCGGFVVPKISGQEQEYTSPPLLAKTGKGTG